MAVRIEAHAEPLPGYRLIERLGGGGFGEVWKAEAPGGLHKAIKFVFGDLGGVGDDGQRAQQELKALSRVKTVRHPYILSLERYDIIDGQLLIVMELADKNLWDRFKECRAQGHQGIPRDELLLYMEETAEALDLMNHDYQLQHLDIKPQNLFLIHQHVKVADFGLVKDLEGSQASVTGGVTPVYAAPETFDGVVTRFSDQYSLAICYQELLTGQRPFNGASVRQLIMQHISAAPNLAPLPPPDQPAIQRGLAKEPNERFPRCRDLVAALRGASAAAAAHSNGCGPRPSAKDTISDARPGDLLLAPSDTPTKLATPRPAPDSAQGATQSLRAIEEAVLSTPLRRAPVEVKGDGCLFPALVIGLGASGLGVLQRLRETLSERFGALEQLPQLRTLLLDTDPEVMRLATRGRPGAALSPAEVLLAPLNRPSYYLKPRDGRSDLEKWLNPRMLYRIPRTQVTTGVRALGRLAFCDHYRAIARRLQRELEACLEPSALAAAARNTKLGVRSNRPRVYVVANLAGGTGGGIFLDLAYTLRVLLRQLGYDHADIVGLLLLPPVERSRSRVLTLGNTYAALTELSHYAQPGAVFHARYHDREPPVQESDPPFSRCVLLPLAAEHDETAARELAELAGQYLHRDLASALGRSVDLSRAGLTGPPWESRGLYCQTFGLYQLTWPRHALVRQAARRLCQRLVQRWMSKDGKPLRDAVHDWMQEQWRARELAADRFTERLRESCGEKLPQRPDLLLRALIDPLDKQLREALEAGSKRGGALELAPEKVAEVLTLLEEQVGKPNDGSGGESRGAVVEAVRAAAAKLGERWSQKLAELPVRLIEEPEFRLAGAEECIRDGVAAIELTLQSQEPLARDLAARTLDWYVRLQAWLRPRPGSRRPALTGADVVELLRSYAKGRFQCLLLQQTGAAFVTMRGQLSDALREINSCRVRLAELLKMLEMGSEESIDLKKAYCRQLFPSGCKGLSASVERILSGLDGSALLELDQRLQERIRRDFRALVHVCLTSANVMKNVETALLRTAEAFVAERLPEADVAAFFLEQHADPETASAEIANLFQEAAPELSPGREHRVTELCLLATPPGPAGERFRQLAQEATPEVEWNTTASAEDILLYRELPHVPLETLPQLGPLGQDAYKQMTGAEHFTPHTRIDVTFSKSVE